MGIYQEIIMTTSKDDIKGWFDRGIAQNKDFMIIVCDTFNYEDYPVYCSFTAFNAQYNAHSGKNMQRIMEVYDLSMDRDKQLAENRAFNKPV